MSYELAPSPQSSWLGRSVSKLGLRRRAKPTDITKKEAKHAIAAENINKFAIEVIATTDRAMRSTHERLKASLKAKDEALSPRVLRRSLAELQAVADKAVSEVEGSRRAQGIMRWYGKATMGERRDLWLLMSEQFAADAAAVKAAREKYDEAVGTTREGAAEAGLRKALESPRRRLLQRFSAAPQGIRFLIDMRQEWLPEIRGEPRLLALDGELEALFSTWFDVGFLELRRLSWDSPASLLEKLIRYEAVHDIKSWSDLKNRLDSDRRCYGFFHSRLTDEPLIFVEVALVNEIATGIGPLLDESAHVGEVKKASTAIFYSISNTQVGLRGVGFGDSLIKRVVETLKAELPQLKTFATLSPIPGFRAWLQKKQPQLVALAEQGSAQEEELCQAAARYLVHEFKDGQPLDAVAKFHLGNGASVERINYAADMSAKGIKQSLGLMVNYLYALKQIDKNRGALQAGKIAHGAQVKKYLG